MAAVLPSIPTGPSPPDPVRRSWDKSSLVSLLVTQSGLPIATGDGMAPLAPPPHVNASEKLAEADMQRMVLELFDIRSMWMMEVLVRALRLFTSYHGARKAIKATLANPEVAAAGRGLVRAFMLKKGANYVVIYSASRASDVAYCAVPGIPIGDQVCGVVDKFMSFGITQRAALLRWVTYWTRYKAQRSWFVSAAAAGLESAVVVPLRELHNFELTVVPAALAAAGAAVVAGEASVDVTPLYERLAALTEALQDGAADERVRELGAAARFRVRYGGSESAGPVPDMTLPAAGGGDGDEMLDPGAPRGLYVEPAHIFNSTVEVPIFIGDAAGSPLHSAELKLLLPAAWRPIQASMEDVYFSSQLAPHGRRLPRRRVQVACAEAENRVLEFVYHRGALGVDALVALVGIRYADGSPAVARMTLSVAEDREAGVYMLSVQGIPFKRLVLHIQHRLCLALRRCGFAPRAVLDAICLTHVAASVSAGVRLFPGAIDEAKRTGRLHKDPSGDRVAFTATRPVQISGCKCHICDSGKILAMQGLSPEHGLEVVHRAFELLTGALSDLFIAAPAAGYEIARYVAAELFVDRALGPTASWTAPEVRGLAALGGAAGGILPLARVVETKILSTLQSHPQLYAALLRELAAGTLAPLLAVSEVEVLGPVVS